MARTQAGGPMRAVSRGWLGVLLATSLLTVIGCSPEDGRTQGSGLGADVGNTSLPIRLHGDQSRNNPSFHVPFTGGAPRDAKGVPGWWANAR